MLEPKYVSKYANINMQYAPKLQNMQKYAN